MDKEQMISIVKKYLANKYECDINLLNKKGLNIIKNNKENNIKILSFFDLILVTCSNNLYDLVIDKLYNKNIDEIFEFPLVYGESIYYIPYVDKIDNYEKRDNLEFRMFDGDTDKIDLNSGFEKAITYKNGRCISDIAYCAYDNSKIIGIAGADKINDDIWEVGIEIMPEYRKNGLATLLMKELTAKIIDKGIVPIWCASATNIGSQAVAHKCNYIPLWVESYGDIFDNDYTYKELINIGSDNNGKE